MPLHDAHYKHWEGEHLGVWNRRWVIAQNGLTSCFRNKATRSVVVMAWMAALSTAALLFIIGQLLVPDSILVEWVRGMNSNLQGLAQMLTGWLTDHPEISVRTTQDVVFYYFGAVLTPVSIFALGMTVPVLVTRDLASNAIIIYSSKAVSRGDYLLGKFATAFGLLTLTWLGPMCAAWFFGNLLAPDWRFFWHARAPLVSLVIYGLVSMTTLSLLALAVSAVSSKEKSTTALWFVWWILGMAITPIALHTQPWLAHLSFNYNLSQIEVAVFGLGHDLQTAQDNMPILGQLLRNIRPETIAALNAPAVWSSVFALGLMATAAVWIILKRVKPS